MTGLPGHKLQNAGVKTLVHVFAKIATAIQDLVGIKTSDEKLVSTPAVKTDVTSDHLLYMVEWCFRCGLRWQPVCPRNLGCRKLLH